MIDNVTQDKLAEVAAERDRLRTELTQQENENNRLMFALKRIQINSRGGPLYSAVEKTLSQELLEARAELEAELAELAECQRERDHLRDTIICHYCRRQFTLGVDDLSADEHWRECPKHPARNKLDTARTHLAALLDLVSWYAMNPTDLETARAAREWLGTE